MAKSKTAIPATHEVQVVVTLKADMDASHTNSDVRKAAVQAVENAVRRGEDNGFSHDLSDDVSFRLLAVEAVGNDH